MRLIPADPWLKELEKSLRSLRRGDSPEAAHEFRVAIARLRVWLDLGGWHLLDDDLRALRQSAARLRNFDAQLEEGPPGPLAARWRRERDQERQAFLGRLKGFPVAAMLEVLHELPPVARRDAKKAVAKLARRALEDGAHLESVEQLHVLRRDLRKLRYAQEWLERDAARLSDAQDAAGKVVDAKVAIDLSHGPTARKFRSEKRFEIGKARKKARKRWRGVKRQIKGLAR